MRPLDRSPRRRLRRHGIVVAALLMLGGWAVVRTGSSKEVADPAAIGAADRAASDVTGEPVPGADTDPGDHADRETASTGAVGSQVQAAESTLAEPVSTPPDPRIEIALRELRARGARIEALEAAAGVNPASVDVGALAVVVWRVHRVLRYQPDQSGRAFELLEGVAKSWGEAGVELQVAAGDPFDGQHLRDAQVSIWSDVVRSDQQGLEQRDFWYQCPGATLRVTLRTDAIESASLRALVRATGDRFIQVSGG